ncbi:MAG: ABC transporter ATP-binding protein [Saccharofermentans sp.]|nr:ABC transporter ATP-binding protein [Saccharofermentans sp.]
MIRFNEICKTYVMGDEVVHALDHANIHIKQGEFVSIIGPSGSGKSTLMNIMGCLDTASSGEYYLDGLPIEQYSEKDLARIRNKKIGFIFQNFNLITTMTAEENVELPLIYQGVKASERRARVKEALTLVDLYSRKDHTPNQMSGGQQQRVAIARAVAAKPSLFLADEPTGNLDSATGKQIMDIFKALNKQGNTIVLITHDDSVAAQAQRSIRISDGKVSDINIADNEFGRRGGAI